MNDLVNFSRKIVLHEDRLRKPCSLKQRGKTFLSIQVYVDDIIVSANNNVLCQQLSNFMSKEFKMWVVGEHTFFLGFRSSNAKIAHLSTEVSM